MIAWDSDPRIRENASEVKDAEVFQSGNILLRIAWASLFGCRALELASDS